MKFQKGSKVEVMNNTELPTSWCLAEVVSRNKHTYSLRYDCCYPNVENVPSEFIRPCPPRANNTHNWVVGDIVEVLDDSSWKTATLVCKVPNEDDFSVRPHGCVNEIIAHKSNIRPRQVWQHGQWLPVVKYGSQPKLKIRSDQKDDNLLIYDDSGLLKRASSFCADASNKKLKDDGFYEKERILSNANSWNYSVDSNDNDDCSIGSSSTKWSSHYAAGLLPSDAESSTNGPRDKHAVVRGLESRAYHFTLQALYASGPLNWDKEALLTNLRINLHISNDEHLMELRNLISKNKQTNM